MTQTVAIILTLEKTYLHMVNYTFPAINWRRKETVRNCTNFFVSDKLETHKITSSRSLNFF